IATKVEKIPSFLEQQRKNLEDGMKTKARFYKKEVEREAIELQPVILKYFQKDVIESAKKSLAKSDLEKILPRLQSGAEKIDHALTEFTSFLKSKILPLSNDKAFAIGEEEYAWRLQNILFSKETPATLYEYGKKQVAETAKEMQQVADEIQK